MSWENASMHCRECRKDFMFPHVENVGLCERHEQAALRGAREDVRQLLDLLGEATVVLATIASEAQSGQVIDDALTMFHKIRDKVQAMGLVTEERQS